MCGLFTADIRTRHLLMDAGSTWVVCSKLPAGGRLLAKYIP